MKRLIREITGLLFPIFIVVLVAQSYVVMNELHSRISAWWILLSVLPIYTFAKCMLMFTSPILIKCKKNISIICFCVVAVLSLIAALYFMWNNRYIEYSYKNIAITIFLSVCAIYTYYNNIVAIVLIWNNKH